MEVSNPIVDPRYLKRGPFKDQATVRVMVLNADEPPQFSQTLYHLDVSENCPPVCSVGRVYAVDPDTGQSSNIRLHHHSLIHSLRALCTHKNVRFGPLKKMRAGFCVVCIYITYVGVNSSQTLKEHF